ncbi:uncharacterized protein LOC108148706 [Drosophila elegans]|uniref:uncharacterized protein LOC108148706 n=1 Tax=Drosophila elegans TaxID=30023 RepID=UPI0007E8A086|nr:uncharacterized protein LOC108148706 [Drosophila elegans]
MGGAERESGKSILDECWSLSVLLVVAVWKGLAVVAQAARGWCSWRREGKILDALRIRRAVHWERRIGEWTSSGSLSASCRSLNPRSWCRKIPMLPTAMAATQKLDSALSLRFGRVAFSFTVIRVQAALHPRRRLRLQEQI